MSVRPAAKYVNNPCDLPWHTSNSMGRSHFYGTIPKVIRPCITIVGFIRMRICRKRGIPGKISRTRKGWSLLLWYIIDILWISYLTPPALWYLKKIQRSYSVIFARQPSIFQGLGEFKHPLAIPTWLNRTNPNGLQHATPGYVRHPLFLFEFCLLFLFLSSWKWVNGWGPHSCWSLPDAAAASGDPWHLINRWKSLHENMRIDNSPSERNLQFVFFQLAMLDDRRVYLYPLKICCWILTLVGESPFF